MITTITALLTPRIPFSVLVLADLIIRTSGNVAGVRVAVEGGALELTVGQREAVGAVGAGGKGTVPASAHHLGAEFTWRTGDRTGADDVGVRAAGGVAWWGNGGCEDVCSWFSIFWIFIPLGKGECHLLDTAASMRAHVEILLNIADDGHRVSQSVGRQVGSG